MLDSLFIGSFIAESWLTTFLGCFVTCIGSVASSQLATASTWFTQRHHCILLLSYYTASYASLIFDSDTSFYMYMSPWFAVTSMLRFNSYIGGKVLTAPGGINSSLSGAPCPPGGRLPRPLRGLPLPGNGPIPGPKPGPTGSNRAPGGAPIGGR